MCSKTPWGTLKERQLGRVRVMGEVCGPAAATSHPVVRAAGGELIRQMEAGTTRPQVTAGMRASTEVEDP